MGTDKALLPWNGQPLWERQAALLRASGADPVAVIRRPDQTALSELCWRDRRSDRGPLAGLEVALQHCPAGGTIAVLAVDMPFLDADWFHWLTAEVERVAPNPLKARSEIGPEHRQGLGRVGDAPPPLPGVVAWHVAAFEPLAAIYPAAALAEVSARLDRGELSLQALIRKLVADELMYAIVLPDNRLPAVRSLNSIT
jgi:molybdenum cofactor guanylyltransferase